MDKFTSNKRSTAVYVDPNDGMHKCIYHNTCVVCWNVDSGVINLILNSGGYRTVTTKRRMNEVSRCFDLGYSVFQKDHEWYVTYNGKTVPFVDDMQIIYVKEI